MSQRIAVDTLTLNELSKMFQKAIEIGLPKSKGAIANQIKRLKKLGIGRYRWIKTL